MRLSTKTAAVTAAVALMTTPAIAARPADPGSQGKGKGQEKAQTERGKSTAPGQICRNESRKKTNKGKGKSPFAACVAGVKRANRDARAVERAEEQGETREKKSPGQLCRNEPRKKDSNDSKSPFAACVTAAEKAQKKQKEQEEETTSVS